MKWFQHDSTASRDPKLQILGASCGAEGIGIYWGILEEICQHSDTFHLKIFGISQEPDQKFSEIMQSEEKAGTKLIHTGRDLACMPRLPIKILAKNLFTSAHKLRTVIDVCVEAGLFDPSKWLNYNVLYSPAFEHRADDYTRRVRRTPNNVRRDTEQTPNIVRTLSEQSTNIVRTKSEACSDNVRLETEVEVEEKESRNRKDKKMLIKNTPDVDNLKSDPSAKASPDYLIEPTDDVFDEYSLKFQAIIQEWNRERPSQAIRWSPTVSELRKLFCGGDYERKLSMCFHAYKLLGGKVHYPELVIRSLRLLLKTNAGARIANPFGWLWTSLHGNGNGTKPWVQLLTADEENGSNHH